jgi:hypothetical protein
VSVADVCFALLAVLWCCVLALPILLCCLLFACLCVYVATLQAFLSSGTIGLFVLSPATTRIILPAEHTTGEQLYAELDTVRHADRRIHMQREWVSACVQRLSSSESTAGLASLSALIARACKRELLSEVCDCGLQLTG